MKRILPLLALLILPAFASAATVDLGTRGTLSIAVPKGWTLSTQKEEDAGFALTISPPSGVNAKLLLNIAFVPEPKPVSKEEVNEKVLSVCDQFVDASVEKKKVLQDFSLTAPAFGSYCVFTDASLVGQPPKPDEFKIIGVGIIRYTDDVMGAVSLACDDPKGADYAAMMAAVSSTSLSPKK
jgi:hypothetical protein